VSANLNADHAAAVEAMVKVQEHVRALRELGGTLAGLGYALRLSVFDSRASRMYFHELTARARKDIELSLQ
jgi:hypothetical protein